MTAPAAPVHGIALNWRSLWLGWRMACWAVAARLLVRVVPLRQLVRLVEPRAASLLPHERDVTRIVALSQTVTRYTASRPEARCLVRSLVAYRYLALAGRRPELHVGFERTAQGLRGHAWVVLEGAPVTDDPRDLAALTPSMAFVHEVR
jgi:Transglutaminase-like superfamily